MEVLFAPEPARATWSAEEPASERGSKEKQRRWRAQESGNHMKDKNLSRVRARAGALGGKARAANLSPAQLSAIGRKAGRLGGKASAAARTPEERSEHARKAGAKSALLRRQAAAERRAKKGK